MGLIVVLIFVGVFAVVALLLYAGGAGAMPVKAPELGLDNHWQAQILAAVGDYGAIYDRHLGKQSGLNLPRGPNDNQANGGLLLAPFLE